MLRLMSTSKVGIAYVTFKNKDAFSRKEASKMVKFEEIDLKEDGKWGEEGFTIKVVECDIENYRQKLEARFKDTTETWYFGLYEQNFIELFDGALLINDKGANFKKKVQKISIETK